MIELVCDKAQSLKQFTDANSPQASFYFSQLLKNREIKYFLKIVIIIRIKKCPETVLENHSPVVVLGHFKFPWLKRNHLQ